MIDYESYIRYGEPEKAQKAQNWSTAIGLQKVDGLQTSGYLNDVAIRNIEGEITVEQARHLINSYYQNLSSREAVENNVEEADRAAANINVLLAEPSFTFSVSGLAAIHRRIFEGVFKHAGKFRDYDITKKEWVLRGATVIYGMASELRATVEYDLDREKAFSYKGLSKEALIAHIARFIADLWQIHPFGEGNTRTTAVFLIKYLREKGFPLDNTPFREHSWYFRNALVRANFNDLRNGITADYKYLERFLSNIILGTNYPLKNRFMHLDYHHQEEDNMQTGTENLPVNPPVNLPVNLPVKQRAILDELAKNPSLTYEALAQKIGCSRETVRVHIKSLVSRGVLTRIGSDKSGHWQINQPKGGNE